ncbi:PIH1 domain-containing protein 1 [Copidosoma floridanum]|uniref:PIH1 domain-containing protein 1 n=1 Tax=Copidosoma floridanum TaxID=29053 RepID=UPI0006C974CC|nr:PIH1 domain-containing protein 1 [Copidosoma floridanum]
MTLDVDDSAINKKLQILSTEPQDNVISWLQNDGNKNIPKVKKIDPFPGICIKTWSESGDKIFINLCHSKEIVPPEDISDEKFRELMTQDVPSFVIPMAIGTEKMAKDKQDIERSTYDILINTKYFDKCRQKGHFLRFTVAAILESINDKYKQSIDVSKYVILQNRKVMGYLDTFTVEDREAKKPVVKKPLIQVIDIPEETQNKPKITDSNIKYHPKVNNFVILKSSSENHLLGLFYLPLAHLTDITVDIGGNRIIVESKRTDVIIDTLLPHSIDDSHVSASFDSKLHILRLMMPLNGKS